MVLDDPEHPNTGLGAAYLDCKDSQMVDRLMHTCKDLNLIKYASREDKEKMQGLDRILSFQRDPDSRLIKEYVTSRNLDYEVTGRFHNIIPVPRGRGHNKRKVEVYDSSRDRDRDRDSAKRHRSVTDLPPPKTEIVIPSNRAHDEKGRPLIDNVTDLCESVIFFDGLHIRETLKAADQRRLSPEKFIAKMFDQFGLVRAADITSERRYEIRSDMHHYFQGVVEFARARDAERCLIIMGDCGNLVYEGIEFRAIRVRKAREMRKLPDGLKNINRPLKETEWLGGIHIESVRALVVNSPCGSQKPFL